MTPPDIEDEGALNTLAQTLLSLSSSISDLADDVPAALDVDDSTTAVVELLHDLREQRKRLAEMEAYVEACAVKRLKYGQQQVGDFIAEVRGGKDRRAWQHDKIAWAVCRDLAVDDQGAVVEDMAQVIDTVRNRLMNCAQISGWRVTQVRPLGIEPDDFCESVPGRKTVAVTPAIDAEPLPAPEQVAS